MTEGKTESKERQFSLLEVLFIACIIAAISFLATYYFLIPKGLGEIFVFSLSICFFLMVYFWREEVSIVWSMSLFAIGLWIGGILNITLSTEFLSEPSVAFPLVGLFSACILLWVSLTLRRDISWTEKLGFVFLGCWVASLILALVGFYTNLSQWLSLLPSQEMTGGHMQVEASVTINILKSLFLSGVFNVLERIMRLSKEGVK